MPEHFELRRRDFIKSALSIGACAGLPLLRPLQFLDLETHTLKELPYKTGNWSTDAFDPLGNHRAVVRVTRLSDAVSVRIAWRRHDADPKNKNIVMLHGAAKAAIRNLVRVDINREFGDLIFQPEHGPGEYFIYYLPTSGPGRSRSYPAIIYPQPVSTADPAWLERNHLVTAEQAKQRRFELPLAEVVGLESVDAFNSFFPMGVIATAVETEEILHANPQSALLLFPEDRTRSIRMVADLPRLWVTKVARHPFAGTAMRNEYYTMQLGAYAAHKSIENLKVGFGEFRTSLGANLPSLGWTCFNTGGVDWSGHNFTRQVSVEQGRVQPLWVGVQIPEDAQPGEYSGTITVSAENAASVSTDIKLAVSNELAADKGDSDPYHLSRLRWLNSRLAEDDSIVPPFIPASLSGDTVNILGRSVTVGSNGFPAQIRSTFSPQNTHLTNDARYLLSAPISLVIEQSEQIDWKPGKLQFEPHMPGRVDWTTSSTAGPWTMRVGARMEFDGHIEFTVALSSTAAREVTDIRLEVPYSRNVATYMMGLGQKGGHRPPSFHWKWDVEKNQDSVWVGDVNAGMQVSLRDDKYARPLNTNFYHLKPLIMPASWSNGGHGGCNVVDRDAHTTLLTCYSGPRTVQPGETLYYNFNLLLTPFKPVNTRGQWHDRYYHNGEPAATDIKATGANVINIHHANPINPYLNYPFLRQSEMKTYIDQAHSVGLKVKIYYTVRELSDHAPEIFALRSLGHEIFVPGPGGGYSWLQEQLGSDYIAGWCVPEQHDATIINSGASRWHNYYVEGIHYLAQNLGIDGLYLDDLAFDRSIMQRVRRVLDNNRPGALIDLHSANQYDERDGFASSANLYMGELPYIDRLWFGEYFDYNASPDYYLVEISGLCFGLMSEMLQGGGNPWRGMVYGMTTRLGASGDPRPLWKIWDEFGMEDSHMEGYWVPSTPVTTSRKDIPATSYVRKDAVLIALASWAPEAANIKLHVNWQAIGMEQPQALLTAPAIDSFQQAAIYKPSDDIPVSAGRGLILILSTPSHKA